MAMRLVIKTRISTSDLFLISDRTPELLDNPPRIEVWIDDNICADSIEEAMEYLRAFFKQERDAAEKRKAAEAKEGK